MPKEAGEKPESSEVFDNFTRMTLDLGDSVARDIKAGHGKPKRPKPHAPAGAAMAEPIKEPVTSDSEK